MNSHLEDKFITITNPGNGTNERIFKRHSIVKLVKEPDNEYDDETIAVEMRHVGRMGYVANSVHTVIRGTMSAGRIYDKIGDEAYGEVKFYSKNMTIAKILDEDEIEKLKGDSENDINFI